MSTTINIMEEESRLRHEEMQIDSLPSPVSTNMDDGMRLKYEEMQIDSSPSSSPLQRIPSPSIVVCNAIDQQLPSSSQLQTDSTSVARDRKKSPAGAAPRQRKRSQPVRGDLLPDPDKLLSYKHHDKREEEPLEDPTFPGGQPKPPPEPRQPGEPAVRKRSNVTFCPVVETIEK